MFADLHIHGRYSLSTSPRLHPEELARWGAVKGVGIIGTGDLTHPEWRRELERSLEEVDGTGLYRTVAAEDGVRFMVTGEVTTIWRHGGRVRRVHHLLLAPSLEEAEEVSEALQRYGRLAGDGRPILKTSAEELVGAIVEASPASVVVPAHVWTPHYSLFAAGTGFDSIEECYGDESDRIFALETGLSSDPAMNWRLSALDGVALVSNSDCHSPWPWRLGREANILNLRRLTYDGVVEAIRSKDPERFLGTVEVYPAYGKYHWSGHRSCGVSMPPERAAAAGGLCPVCGKPMTKGVEERVEELADRPRGFRPEGAAGFRRLMPLHEIIAKVIGVSTLDSKGVWKLYDLLVKRFGTEYAVLLDASVEELAGAVGRRLAEAIIAVREGRVEVRPGYDGVYGEVSL
ncbi:MAG: endonuclease Q family protein [Candidatus Bathyarchaeia archaeon]